MIKDKIDINNLPTHIAIIMDGNGRWAKRRGNKRIAGHKSGVNAVRAVSEAAAEIGVKNVTLYTFSTENWNRPKQEVDILMDLLVKAINSETDTLMKNNIRLTCIGDITRLPENNLKKLNEVMAKTKDNTRLNLTLALSYSSRWEITEAVKSIAEKIRSNEINVDDITEDFISASLSTKDIPDPDLLIRTSGEYRLSNFLLWQSAYTELYFTDVLWPDFNKDVFYEAIYEYQNRERRFGKTSEQIN